MNQDARRIIASYLTGGRIAHEDLECACETLNKEDPERAEAFVRALGLNPDWTSECHVFLAHVDAFCDMAPEDQRAQMPALARHVEECPACRAVYWDVKGYWSEELVQGAKRLIEHIRLCVNAAGALIEQGICPPELVLDTVGTKQGMAIAQGFSEEARPPAAGEKHWVLTDEDAGFALRLDFETDPDGGVSVRCSVEAMEGAGVNVHDAKVSIRNAEAASPKFSARFRDFPQVMPVVSLPAGSWTITVQAPSERGPLEWTIPVDTETLV